MNTTHNLDLYLRKMLDHSGVVQYLSQHFAEVLSEFQRLVDTPDLKAGA